MRAAGGSPGGEDFAQQTRRATDPDVIAGRLATGVTVVLVGPVGAGKTETLDRVRQALGRRVTEVQLIRGAASVRGASLPLPDGVGERDAASSTQETLPPGVVLLVDDAHDLDPASASALIEAVCRRRLTVCFAVEVPTGVRAAIDARTTALLDLAARGFARRIDLEPLAEAEASAFLRARGSVALDEVTQDAIVWSANGSRALLQEFADAARDASESGRDPLEAIREAPRWTRLAEAVQTHLAELDEGHLSTLVSVHRFPGLASSHAARIRPAHELDALRSRGHLYRDGSVVAALWVNPVFGREAARVLGPERVEEVLASAVARMLDADGGWWSPPIAAVLADMMLRGAVEPGSVPVSLRRRAFQDAARQCNDQERFALAEAHAFTGLADDPDDVGLLLELAHARVSVGETEAARIPPDIADSPARSRALVIDAAWEAHGAASHAEELRTALKRGAPADADPRLLLADVEVLGWSLYWNRARDLAHDAAERTSGYWRVSAWVAEAQARGHLGDPEGANRALARVEGSVFEVGVSGLGTAERLWLLMRVLLTHVVLGEDAPQIHERIARERRRAVREGDDRVMGSAGLAAALSSAVRGDCDAALKNLDAARARFTSLRRIRTAAAVKVWIAQFLANNGRTHDARAIVERVSTVWSDGPLALRHGCAAARALIDALDRRYDEAARAVREALALTAAREAPMLRARDLYRGIALEVVDEDAVAEIAKLIGDARVPLKTSLVEPPPRLSRVHRSADLRAAFARTLIAKTPSAARGAASASGAAAALSDIDLLTPREVEIAGLISAGLSNNEIAERLFLSVRTVESHIYQARGKVGAASRRELGARVGAARSPR